MYYYHYYIFFLLLTWPGHVTFGVRCHPRKPPRQYEPNLHRTKFNLNPLFGHFSATTEPFERKLAWHIPCFVNLVATEWNIVTYNLLKYNKFDSSKLYMNDLTLLSHLEERLVESKMAITTGHNYYWTLRKWLKISSWNLQNWFYSSCAIIIIYWLIDYFYCPGTSISAIFRPRTSSVIYINYIEMWELMSQSCQRHLTATEIWNAG